MSDDGVNAHMTNLEGNTGSIAAAAFDATNGACAVGWI